MRFHPLILAAAVLSGTTDVAAFQLPINSKKIISVARIKTSTLKESLVAPKLSLARLTIPKLSNRFAKQPTSENDISINDDKKSSKQILALVTTCCLTALLRPTEALAAMTHPNMAGVTMGAGVVMGTLPTTFPDPTTLWPATLIGPGMFNLGSGGMLWKSGKSAVILSTAALVAVSSMVAMALYPAYAWMMLFANTSSSSSGETTNTKTTSSTHTEYDFDEVAMEHAPPGIMGFFDRNYSEARTTTQHKEGMTTAMDGVRSLFASLSWMTLFVKCHTLSQSQPKGAAAVVFEGANKEEEEVKKRVVDSSWDEYSKDNLLVKKMERVVVVDDDDVDVTGKHHTTAKSQSLLEPMELDPMEKALCGPDMQFIMSLHTANNERKASKDNEEEQEAAVEAKKLQKATKMFKEQQYEQHHHPVHVARTKFEQTSYLDSLAINEETAHDTPKSYLDTLSNGEKSTWDKYSNELEELEMKSKAYEKTIREDFEYDKVMKNREPVMSASARIAAMEDEHDEQDALDDWDWEHVQDMGSGIK